MIKNYFKTAWRIFWGNKFFSAINLLGLSTGLACCILIFLFIQNELSYDKHNTHAENIYRVTSEAEGPNGTSDLAVTPAPWAPLMKNNYPEIKSYTRLLKAEKAEMGQAGKQHFYETDLIYSDSTFFDVFSVQIEKGSIKKALAQPNSIILTDATAKKYFGNEDPIGKTLQLSSFVGIVNVQVTAIAKKLPANTHFQFGSLVSLSTLGNLDNFWSYHMFHSYVLLNSKSSAATLEKKFPSFVDKYITNNPQADGKQNIHLQPLTSIHLHSNMTGELGINGDIIYVYVLAGIAIFILLIACFNFINLSTARALTRAKEVGLRKVVGASKKQLFSQFLGETTFFASVSLMLAIIISFLALPIFNQLSQRQLAIDFTANYQLYILLVLLIIVVGFFAGLYPGLILTAFKPVEVLKGKFIKAGTGVMLRKSLVILQFVVSIVLTVSTIIVSRQLNYMQTKKPGFEKENVVVLSLPHDMDTAKMTSFKASLVSDPSIVSVGGSSSVPGVNIPVNQVNDGNIDLSKAESMQMLFIDQDFTSTMKMKLLAGRNFETEQPTDKAEGFILNEEAVKKMGWKNPANAIGKTIQWVLPDRVLKKGKVLGVVANFNITPLKTTVQPLVMHCSQLRVQYLYVRFNQKNATTILSVIRNKFSEFYPNQSLEYSFLDNDLNELYAAETRLATIFTYFSFLAIFIACLGVLGLSIYSIQQRIKEIGIRKVVGASVLSITVILIKEFIKPVFIAAIIASPIAWYVMSKWLQSFAYRVNISWWIFAAAGFGALIIALITVSFQSIKAAVANPIKSLRTE